MPIMLFLAYCVNLADNAIRSGRGLFLLKRLFLADGDRQNLSRDREMFDFELLVAVFAQWHGNTDF